MTRHNLFTGNIAPRGGRFHACPSPGREFSYLQDSRDNRLSGNTGGFSVSSLPDVAARVNEAGPAVLSALAKSNSQWSLSL
ncbi:hypothetical protein [Tatumella ptyseos]|uniref:hypothetical protein n=1 Tax=Tatumella ptyseos TaxID=82987 RepID=UPI0004BA000A|nr:hypothetical protein [Tatumella ptyseos]